MKPDKYFNLLDYTKSYFKLNYKFESDIAKLIYDNLLVNNHHNGIFNESIEFVYSIDNFPNNKYKCKLRINFDNEKIPCVEFTLFDKPKIIYKNDQIQKQFPNLYNQIILWWNKNVIDSESFIQVVRLKKEIISIKKYILENFTLDNFPTHLYRYYYSNIHRFIKIGELKSYKNFYIWMCDKYNLDSDKTNFQLDYLQHYFQNNMFLMPDHEVTLPDKDDDDIIIKFTNSKITLEIKLYPRRYTAYYQPKYIVVIKETDTNNIISGPTYEEFDSDRNLDKYYENLIDYISEFLNEIR